MTSPALLVLAAGMGARYGGLKQIDPVGPNGETILDYSVFDARRAGFGRVVFVIRRAIETDFRQAVGARFEKRMDVAYVFQELDALPERFIAPSGRSKPWGTTHAILMAADAIREPFAAINADDFYGAESYRAMAAHFAGGSGDSAMAAFTLRNTLSDFGAVARGVCQAGAGDYLASVTELTRIERDGAGAKNTGADGTFVHLTGNEPVSMNFWGFMPSVFPLLHRSFEEFLKARGQDASAECYIPSTVAALIAEGQMRVKMLRTEASWFGVTYREDRPRVVESIRQLTAQEAYPNRLWEP